MRFDDISGCRSRQIACLVFATSRVTHFGGDRSQGLDPALKLSTAEGEEADASFRVPFPHAGGEVGASTKLLGVRFADFVLFSPQTMV